MSSPISKTILLVKHREDHGVSGIHRMGVHLLFQRSITFVQDLPSAGPTAVLEVCVRHDGTNPSMRRHGMFGHHVLQLGWGLIPDRELLSARLAGKHDFAVDLFTFFHFSSPYLFAPVTLRCGWANAPVKKTGALRRAPPPQSYTFIL